MVRYLALLGNDLKRLKNDALLEALKPMKTCSWTTKAGIEKWLWISHDFLYRGCFSTSFGNHAFMPELNRGQKADQDGERTSVVQLKS